MSITSAQPGRPSGSEQKEIPPRIFQALTFRAGGATWSDSAEAAGVHIRTLRKYREYPECKQFLETTIKESLNTAHTKLLDASPRIADELISIAISKKTKDYAKVAAASEIFKIIREGIMDVEMRQQVAQIKEQLASIERGGPIVDV